MSVPTPAPDAAYEIAVNVADEIEVAGDRTPDPDGDLDLDNDDDPDQPQEQRDLEPEHQPDLDLDVESEVPEPAGPGNAQHERPLQSHEPQGQTRQDTEDSQAEGATSQGPVNGHAPTARAASASASASAPNQESEEHKGQG